MKPNAYDTFHEVLVNLFHDIMEIETKALITEDFKDISTNDMHVIEAIGNADPKNMSAVAKALSVTVGTLTIAINNLVKKDYVHRVRSESDRRVVLISLSPKGKSAFEHHQAFHNAMIEATIDGLSENETEILIHAFTNLTTFFQQNS